MESGIPQKPRGTVIANRYEVVAFLGAGRLGSVYLVNDTTQSSLVAMRMFPAAFCSDPVAVQRLSLSVQAMRTVNHRNIARIYDAGMQNGECFCTMEYLRGTPLSDFFVDYDPNRPFPWQAVSGIFEQICLGLHAIHNANLIHGNLCAASVFIEDDDTVKLTDFGIVSAARIPSKHGGVASHQNDLQSLGFIFHQLLTGRVPGTEPTDISHEGRTEAPAWAEKLLTQLLAAKAELRPKNIEAVLRAHEQPVEQAVEQMVQMEAAPPFEQPLPAFPPAKAPPPAASPPRQMKPIDFGDDLSASLREELKNDNERQDILEERFALEDAETKPAPRAGQIAFTSSSSLKTAGLELAAPRKFRSDSMRILMRAFGKKDEKDAEGAEPNSLRSKSLRMMLKERVSGIHTPFEIEGLQKRVRSVSLRFSVPNAEAWRTKAMPQKRDYARVAMISMAILIVCGILAYPRLSYLLSAPRAPVTAPPYRVDQGELAAIEHYVANFRRDYNTPEKLPFHYQNLQAELGILLPESERNLRAQQFSEKGAVVTMTAQLEDKP